MQYEIWAQRVRAVEVTLYLWIGPDVHPIYWSDVLAIDQVVRELRNWSHTAYAS